MYSAVLILALTAGNDSVDFGRNRCNGGACSGYACSGSYVGCTGGHGCSSSRGGLFHRGHGCQGGGVCSGSIGCSSSCSGSRGGLFHRNRCSGSSSCCGTVVVACTGGVGCTGGAGCTGGTPVPIKKDMPKGEPVKDPKKASTEGPATIVVSLPADARLLVDGNATTSTSARRTLVTPALQFGATYIYNMTAEIVVDGRTVTQTQQISVRGGETTSVQFSFPTQTVASR
jgi:uncharacterized protein (TIGR03000 family)